MEEREAAYRKARESVRERADHIRAELAAAIARVDEHDACLGAHGRRLDAHDEEIGALRARVDALSDITVRAHQEEGLPVPPALQPEPLLRLVGDGG